MEFAFPPAPFAGEAGRFVIGALRRYVSGRAHHAIVWRDFARRLAPAHGPAMAAFERFVAAVAEGASRRFRHLPPCAAGVTPDEAALVAFLAAAQRDDFGTAAWHGGDFLAADALPAAAAAARGFAEALLAGGLALDAGANAEAAAAEGWLAAAVCPLA